MNNEHLSHWLGFPVIDYQPDVPLETGKTYRLRIDYDSEVSITELMAAYCADPLAAEATALVIGAWFGDDPGSSSEELVELLVGARHILSKLEAIFFGDVISEESEMSWITQTDVSPLFAAYPGLKHFTVRGSNDLSLGGRMRLEALESLTVETGGLPVALLREVLSLDLPNLERLEIWLGTDEYGWDGTVADLAPLLAGTLFPKLKHLGLRDSSIADAVAEAVAKAPLLDRIESLDLSLGTLSDAGATHLAGSESVRRLKHLDLHHHYCTNEGMRILREAFPGVNLEDQEELDKYGPYVAVGE